MRAFRCKSGFTLLEILVVVLIITILATVVGVKVAGKPGEARIATAESQIVNFRTALNLYRMDNGRLPTAAQGLVALVEKPVMQPVPEKYPSGGYLESLNLPTDPWGSPYVYIVPGPSGIPYDIISYGADTEPGGTGEEADIVLSQM